MTLNEDAYYMSLALKQAERALEEEEIPVGRWLCAKERLWRKPIIRLRC
jgi:tRNA(Arg) A34 adenosine deaminase TadA